MPRKIKAIFIRHSESTGNAANVVKGTKDYPLDQKGKRESAALAKTISSYKPSVVVTSPLKRAQEPAARIANRAGVKLVADRGLLPQDFGHLTGTPRKTGEPQIRRFALRTPGKRIPGGESFREWDGKNNKAMSRVKKLIAQGERPAVVTHSRNLRELKHALFGAKVADPTKGGPEPSGFVTLEGKKKLVIHKGVSKL